MLAYPDGLPSITRSLRDLERCPPHEINVTLPGHVLGVVSCGLVGDLVVYALIVCVEFFWLVGRVFFDLHLYALVFTQEEFQVVDNRILLLQLLV